MQGFKTFAHKTVLEFVQDAGGRRGVTAVVGPNGSGKSNIADALRWVMGEQSLKLLRGKKSEDVIFSGTDQRARSGFAEVTLLIENDDRAEVEFSQIVLTRRLYRDGQSEYEVNRQPARLQDVTLLLAQCGVGQRSYSVIGQGMIDHVLVASPAERKEFFDEAFGLRPFQLKRQSALQKIEGAKDNLAQTEAVLREIGPRLTGLERQVKRLQEREHLEQELHTLERSYYGHHWQEIMQGMDQARGRSERARAEQQAREAEAIAIEQALAQLEQATPVQAGFGALRKALDDLLEQRNALRERQLKLESNRAVAAARAEKPWAPLPLSKIIQTLSDLHAAHEELAELLAAKTMDLARVRAIGECLRVSSAELVGKLQRPAPEPEQESHPDPAWEQEAQKIVSTLADLLRQITEAEERLEDWNASEQGQRKHIFALQHQLNQKRQAAQIAERQAADTAVELARFETRRDTLMAEVQQYAPGLEAELSSRNTQHGTRSSELGAPDGKSTIPLPADAAARLQHLRSQVEWIGGIDPETVKEHQDTKERFDFLTKQTDDLRQTMATLEQVVTELNTTIRERSETAFRRLDREFGTYFKKLFQGGEACLVELEPEPETDEAEEPVETPTSAGPAGIEIQATPPGKRFKSIALLSGGERALTSIALICAIMATHPSPFVVLDEVDAALDESNSRKFADIITSLADKTQCVVITHNRATMTQAHVLYGVTMGDDGASQLLSVKLEDVEKIKQKKAG